MTRYAALLAVLTLMLWGLGQRGQGTAQISGATFIAVPDCPKGNYLDWDKDHHRFKCHASVLIPTSLPLPTKFPLDDLDVDRYRSALHCGEFKILVFDGRVRQVYCRLYAPYPAQAIKLPVPKELQ